MRPSVSPSMDLKNPRLLYLKAILFLITGVLSAGLIFADHPAGRTAALLTIVAWSFARAYYFAFYVIERYVDPAFRYAGLGAMIRYWWGKRR